MQKNTYSNDEDPEGFAICDCGSIIFFGGCDTCGVEQEEITFYSADSSEKADDSAGGPDT